MAEPKLEIEKRLDRVEEAIRTMARAMLTDAEKIEKILRGEKSEEPKE